MPFNSAFRYGFNPRAHAGRDADADDDMTATDCFNPRAHAGRDMRGQVFSAEEEEVSIHAPTRGATLPSAWPQQTVHRFNPRAHAGRDDRSCQCKS